MKRILQLLTLAIPSLLFGQTAVQKVGSGNNALSNGSIVVPSGVSITATGSGSIIATGGVASSMPYTGITLVPTLALLGRTTAATGAAEALTVGTSLSLGSGTLNAIQDIRTSASPTFAAVTATTFTGNLVGSAPAGSLSGTTLASNVVTSSLTTVGTIGTGVWQGSVVAGQYGGTGVANTGKTITLGGNLTTSGAFASTFTMTNTTSVTFPVSGTLATISGSVTSIQGTANQVLANGTSGSPVTGTAVILTTPQDIATTSTPTFSSLTLSSPLTGANGGTGVSNSGKTITLGGNLTTSGAFATTLTATATTGVTLPTTGTLATLAGAEALTNKTYNGNTWTAGMGTLTIATGKVLTQSATLTYTGTDGSSVNFGTGGTVLYSGGAGFVASIAGTTNQITASAATGAVTLSIPSTFVAPGTIAATSTSVANSGADASVITPGGLGVTKNLVVGSATAPTGGFTEGHTVVSTVSTLPRGISNIQITADTASANISGYKSRGTVGAESPVLTADVMLNLRGWGWSGSTTKYVNSTSIRSVVSGTIADNRVPSQMDFYTSTDAAPSVLTIAMSISNAQLLTLTPGGTANGINAITINNPNDTPNKSTALGIGSWFTSGVLYVRPTKASSPGILDILANGAAQDSWIDIGSDYTANFTDGEFLELRKTATGYASLKAKGLGTGTVRQLVLQADGSYVSIGSTSAQTVGTYGLYVNGNTAASSSSTGALQVAGGAGIGGTLYAGGLINAGAGLSVTGTITATSSISSTTSVSATTTVTAGTNLTVGGNTLLTGGTAWLGADTSALVAGNGIKIAPISNAATTERQSIQIDTYNASGASDGFLLFRRARGSEASPTAVQSGDALYSITARGYGATAFPATPRTRLETFAAENWTDSAQGAYLAVQTTPTGGTATAEVIRVSAAGNLLVGTTTDPTGSGNVVGTILVSNTFQSLASSNVTLNANGSGRTISLATNGSEVARVTSAGGLPAIVIGSATNTTGSLWTASTMYEGVDAGNNFITGDGLGLSSNTRSALQMDTYSSTGANSSLIIGRHARGTFASPSGVSNNDSILTIIARAYTSSGSFSGTVAKLEMFAGEAMSSSATGAYITATTTAVGGTTNAEVTRWTAAANFLVGTTAETGLTGAGGVRIGSTTTSTTTGTGALVVLGGAGIAGPEFVGGVLNVAGVATMANTTEATNSTTAGTVVSGGLGVAKKIISASSYTSGAPTAGSAGAWKLGANQTGVALTVSTTNGVRVNVDGTDYTLAVLTTNP